MNIWRLAHNFALDCAFVIGKSFGWPKKGRLLFWIAGGILDIFAQAPTDEWRRPGMDAMVAEPGQVASLLPNPAGLVNSKERRRRNTEAPVRETLTELVSLGFLSDVAFWELIFDKDKRERAGEVRLGVLSSFSLLLGGSLEDSDATLKLFQNLDRGSYEKIVRNTTALSRRTPASVRLRDIQAEGGDATEIQNNLQRDPALVSALSAAMQDVLFEGLENTGWKSFSRLFGFSYSKDSSALSWGFYFGFEQSIAVKMGVANKKVKVPMMFEIDRIRLRTDLPMGLKFYLLAPFRFVLATDFGEAVPGLAFGLGFKFVPYNGFNHYSFGNYLSRNMDASGLELDENAFGALLYRYSGLNLGLDFGVQYHFGAISPKVEFLHLGLKVSDLAGLNIPLRTGGDVLRYALDFDFGVYAEHTFRKNFQLFGGAELIQLRGMIFDPSPFSSLYEPIDHLRVLIGIAVLDNLLRFTLQYYNSNLTFAAQLHAGIFQFGLGVSVNPAVPRSWGAEFTLRFRLPRDGFNRRRYKRRQVAP